MRWYTRRAQGVDFLTKREKIGVVQEEFFTTEYEISRRKRWFSYQNANRRFDVPSVVNSYFLDISKNRIHQMYITEH
jgi:hypothetical protein